MNGGGVCPADAATGVLAAAGQQLERSRDCRVGAGGGSAGGGDQEKVDPDAGGCGHGVHLKAVRHFEAGGDGEMKVVDGGNGGEGMAAVVPLADVDSDESPEIRLQV